MNRIELVALFTDLNRLLEKNDVEGAKEVVTAVLKEASIKDSKEENKN